MYTMTIQLQPNSEKCLYEQLYEFIRQEITEGKLQEGEKLPSTRSLADNLKVARSTVDNAYNQLLDEGYIEARPKKGYFVCKIEASFGEKRERRDSVSEETVENGYRYDLAPHGLSMEAFPYSIWRKLTKEIVYEGNAELFAHGERQGDLGLRQTICRYLHDSRGVNCDPGHLVIGAGNDYLFMLLEKIFDQKRSIAMDNPTYMRAYRFFESFGWNRILFESSTEGVALEDLERSGADTCFVMPSHQYPTGVVMSATRRYELLSWAAKKEGRYIIEDDYDSEFRYQGKPIPSLQSADEADRVIYMGTFSKAIAPAIRVSYMVLPDSLYARYKQNCGFYSCTVSRIDQRILDEFIKGGYFERYLNKMRKLYRHKQEKMLAGLEALREEYSISGENAGLHFVLTAKKEQDAKRLQERAAKEGIRLYDMSESRIGEAEKKPSFLIGFGGLKDDEIEDVTSRLIHVLKD